MALGMSFVRKLWMKPLKWLRNMAHVQRLFKRVAIVGHSAIFEQATSENLIAIMCSQTDSAVVPLAEKSLTLVRIQLLTVFQPTINRLFWTWQQAM